MVIGEGRTVGVWSRCSVNDAGGDTVEGEACGVEGVEEVTSFIYVPSSEGGPFKGRWKIGYFAVVVERLEKALSHRRDSTRIKASLWEARQESFIVEGSEKAISYCPTDIARVKASFRQTGYFTFITVESFEEVISYGSNIARIETSGW